MRLGHLRAGEARETETGQGDREARKQETAGNSRAMGASVPQKTKVMGVQLDMRVGGGKRREYLENSQFLPY